MLEIILTTPPPIAVTLAEVNDANIVLTVRELNLTQVTHVITLSELPAALGSSPFTDGNKGDVTVSNGGLTWELNKTFVNGLIDNNGEVGVNITSLNLAP